jgi:hypothetical protein
MRARVLLLTAAVLSAGAVAARAGATTQPSLIVPVKVSLTTHAVTLSQKQVNRGYYVEFGVRNATAARRVFTVAGRTIAVPPRKLRLLAIQFSVRGTYRYVSRGAGTAVRGTFRVS